MIKAASQLRVILFLGAAFICLTGDLSAQQLLPPLPDRQMEITTFGYRINGRFDFLWYPGQPKFRNEFTINPKTERAYKHYLKVAYASKGLQWTAVGCMASLFFVQHTELSSGIVIGVGSLSSIITIPLSAEKGIRLERAVQLRNKAWYDKVRE